MLPYNALMPAATELLVQGKQKFDERYLASLMSQSQGDNVGIGGGGGSTPNDPRLDYLAQLGDMIMRLQSSQQQSQGGNSGSLNLGGGNITGGFDKNWLMTQTNAGSANGATIGGGGGGGGGKEDPMDDPHNPNRSAVTQRDYGSMKGAGRLQGGWRDFFGVGKGNKMGMGR